MSTEKKWGEKERWNGNKELKSNGKEMKEMEYMEKGLSRCIIRIL